MDDGKPDFSAITWDNISEPAKVCYEMNYSFGCLCLFVLRGLEAAALEAAAEMWCCGSLCRYVVLRQLV